MRVTLQVDDIILFSLTLMERAEDEPENDSAPEVDHKSSGSMGTPMAFGLQIRPEPTQAE